MYILLVSLLLFLAPVFANSPTIPVIFIHRGDSSYLQDSIWQAQQYNQEVIMIGDHTNNHYGIKHYLIDDYFQDAAEFTQIYKHLHTCNDAAYELLCIQRWFILKNFMQQHMINRAFYCDSDVMLYCDVTQELESLRAFDISLMYGNPACLTSHIGHIALFTTYGIEMLCDYIAQFYTNTHTINRWTQWLHAPERIYGEGISDMVLISEFVKSEIMPVGAINEPLDNTTFDINLNQDDNYVQRPDEPLFFTRTVNGTQQQYRFDPVIKDIVWMSNKPHAFNLKLNRYIRFKGLHFQGSLKPLMKKFRKEKIENN